MVVVQVALASVSVSSRHWGAERGRGVVRCGIAEASGEPAPMGQKTKYNDGVFAKAFMTLFARKIEKFGRDIDDKKGWLDYDYDYESFVQVSKSAMQGRNRLQQQQVVRLVLLSMLPPGAPAQFRKLFPPTKWAAEFNAALTVPFFHWLVGPSEAHLQILVPATVPNYDERKQILMMLKLDSLLYWLSYITNFTW
ncbi:hypothetical protein ACS0TY_011298 [Phlomoides rotata]